MVWPQQRQGLGQLQNWWPLWPQEPQVWWVISRLPPHNGAMQKQVGQVGSKAQDICKARKLEG